VPDQNIREAISNLKTAGRRSPETGAAADGGAPPPREDRGSFVLAHDRLDDLVPIKAAIMKDRQIEWDKDDVEALKFMKVDVLALGSHDMTVSRSDEAGLGR